MDRDPNPEPPVLLTANEIPQYQSPTVYKVTRSFDLVNIFAVTFFCSAMFGIFQAANVPLLFQALIIGAITLVALVQMFAPESRVRMAAVGSGWVVVGCLEIYQSALHNVFVDMFSSGCLIFGFGSLLGYCAGTVVAGIFLISDYVRVVLQNIFDSKDQVED